MFQQEEEKLKNSVIGKKICITIDETTDACSRAAVNILFSYFDQTSLVRTHYLQAVNKTTISQLVISTLSYYEISFDNVVLFITDNASYMLAAFNILSPLMPQIKHNTCFAHILNLVGDTWIGYKNFKLLDSTISLIKTTFIYSPARKRRWISFLSLKGDLDPTLPPLPVKTRWNSWFNFAFWICTHFTSLVDFYFKESEESRDSTAISELVKVFENRDNLFYLRFILFFITFNAQL